MTAQTAPQTHTDQDKPWENLFGVCAAIGEDLGFNPLWLRIVLGVGVLWNPVGVAVLYVWLGIAVIASRLLFPKRRKAAATQPELVTATPAASPAPVQEEPQLPLAA